MSYSGRKYNESARLMMAPLTFSELSLCFRGEISCLPFAVDPEVMTDYVLSAISKKLKKMESLQGDICDWYTYWLLIHKKSGQGIGFIGFKGLPDAHGFVEVGYSISPGFRKQGLMTEALEAMAGWVNKLPECKGITAKVLHSNIGSQKVLENCRFCLNTADEQERLYILNF